MGNTQDIWILYGSILLTPNIWMLMSEQQLLADIDYEKDSSIKPAYIYILESSWLQNRSQEMCCTGGEFIPLFP